MAWLGGFSSGLTEIVFLGEQWTDVKSETNRRIEFFREHGFEEAAEFYRAYAFPRADGAEYQLIHTALKQRGYPDKGRARKAHDVLAQMRVSEALLQGDSDAFKMNMPPLLFYPEAWAAYVAHYEKEQPDPPKWFYAEFLDRLGFDRITIEGSAR